MKINLENWSFSQYTQNPLRAFISLGAAPDEASGEVIMQYLVTLTDNDYQELFQSEHGSIEEALLVINEKYGQWNFEDRGAKKTGDGCDSCAAH